MANISQVVGPDTGMQSPEEGRGIKKRTDKIDRNNKTEKEGEELIESQSLNLF